MTAKEFKTILEKHKLWLDTSCEKGTRANLEGINLREANLEGVNLRGANLKEANLGGFLSGANLKGVDLREAYLEGAILQGTDLKGANLKGAYLVRAKLEGANLEETCLEEADLREANLSGANLAGAKLKEANLSGALLENTSIISFTLGKHFGFHHKGYVRIGCIGMSLDKWLKEYKEIGAREDYSEVEIKRYGKMLNLLADEYSRNPTIVERKKLSFWGIMKKKISKEKL